MLVSPLQAEDGRLGGDLGEPNTASVLWDALVEAPSGLALDELVELVALDKEDCEVVLDHNDLFILVEGKYMLSIFGKVRWGVAGVGKIADDFVSSLSMLPGAELVAAASGSSADKAAEFAKRHKFTRSYGSYEELANDPGVDIVYVANLHPQHKATAIQMFEGGKHVLSEKPMTLNGQQAKDMIQAAEANRRLLVEGHWDRLFPAAQATRALAHSGRIGKIRHIDAFFGMSAPRSVERLFDPKMGGGALLDIGVYCLSFIQFMFNGEVPEKVQATATLENGVDTHGSVLLSYPEGKTATATFSFDTVSCNTSTVFGTTGRIDVPECHAPSKIIVKEAMGSEAWAEEKVTQYDFELPTVPPTVQHGSKAFNGYHFPTGEGFYFEACAVHGAVLNHTTDLLGDLPLSQTQQLMDLCDTIRSKMGVQYVEDEIVQ